MTPDPIAALRRVVAALEALGLAYCIGGSLASSIYGPPRSTNDADLVVALRAEHSAPLVAALDQHFMIDHGTVRRAIAQQRSFNVIDYDTLDKIDIFVMTDRPWSHQQLARRRLATASDDPDSPALFFASPEDVVLSKLDWYRRGDEVSDRQWLDILNVLAGQSNDLDWPYLRRWASELGVSDLLVRAAAQIEQSDTRE